MTDEKPRVENDLTRLLRRLDELNRRRQRILLTGFLTGWLLNLIVWATVVGIYG